MTCRSVFLARSRRPGEFTDTVRVESGKGKGHGHADIVADHDDRFTDREMLCEELMDVLCHGALVVATCRLRGIACTVIVDRNDTVTGGGKDGHHMTPLPPGLGITMDENDGFPPGSYLNVMNLNVWFYLDYSVFRRVHVRHCSGLLVLFIGH